jgi:hypothetical protein
LIASEMSSRSQAHRAGTNYRNGQRIHKLQPLTLYSH